MVAPKIAPPVAEPAPPAVERDGVRRNGASHGAEAPPRATGSERSPAALLAGLLLGALVASLVAQPAWPVQAVLILRWVAGWWRMVVTPAAAALALAVVAGNTRAPGRVWPAVRSTVRRSRAWAPGVMAALVGAFAAAYGTGLLSPGAVRRQLLLLAFQLALFPGTPAIALLLAAMAAVLWLDRREERARDRLATWWRIRPRGAEAVLARTWPAVLASVLAAALAAAVFPPAMQGWERADGPDAQRFSFYTSFFNSSFNDERVRQREGFQLGKCGLTLAPGASGSIVFGLERTPETLTLLKPNFYNRHITCADEPNTSGDEPFSNRLEVSADDGRTYQTLLADATVGEVVGDQVLDLTGTLGVSRAYTLRFQATNTTGATQTVLPSFVVSAIVDPLTLPDPAFPVVPYAAACAALAYALARSAGAGRRDAALLALALSAGALAAAAALPDRSLLVLRAAASATSVALVAGWAARSRRRADPAFREPYRVPWLAVLCLLVTLVALDARWTQLMRARTEFLVPDAQGYQAIAAEFPKKLAHYRSERYSPLLEQLYDAGFDGKANLPAVFYAGGNNGREPLWPATLRLVANVLGISAFHTRLTSLLLSVLLAALTCWMGGRLLGLLVGATAGLLVALNGALIVNSVAGLREELVGVLYLVVLAGLFVGWRRGVRPSWRRVTLVGLAGAGVVLVRADMVLLAGASIAFCVLALRWPLRRGAAALALMGALAGPMYVGYAFTHGDPFYPGTYGATVNRNLEFPDRMGTPGFPTAEEYAANWAAGPMISPTTYFFGYHTLPQFAAYTATGLRRIFVDILFRDWRVANQPVAVWLLIAGGALLLLERKWFVPFAILAALLPFYAFMAGVPNPWVFAPRYSHHVMPYAAMAVAYAAWFVPRLVGTTWRARQSARES